MMEHRSHFIVGAPFDAVRDFHRSAASLRAITPPVIPMTGVDAPDPIRDGSQFAFTMWMGPLPLRWVARIEDTTPDGFVDRQLSGPFASWSHKHSFTSIDETTTRVDDQVSYQLKTNLFWRLIGGAMALGLPLLFRYRAFMTRRLLERQSTTNDS
jgi:ligand-binding SRPBCC domain-containing protein